MTRDEIARQLSNEGWSRLRTCIWDQTHKQVKFGPWFAVWGRFLSDPVLIACCNAVVRQVVEDNDDPQ